MSTAAPFPPHAVLWDFDGTLADTEPLWIGAEYELAAELGGSWNDELAAELIGSDLLDSAAFILRAIDRTDKTPAWLVEQLLSRVVAGFRSGTVAWRPGALELLAALNAAGIPCALVSASYRVLLDAVLEVLPPGSFQASVAGDEVVRGKPDPEPYEKAGRMLGVDPAHCLVIEDSPTGARAGNAAGALVLAVRNLVPVPSAPRRVHRESLTEVDVAEVRRLLRQSDGPNSGPES